MAAEVSPPLVVGNGIASTPLTPEKISFNYSNARLSTVLKSIAYSYQLNLVIAKDVKGNVSAQLKDVSLNEALNAILGVNGYGFSRKENIVYIVPKSEIDLATEFISLSFTEAKEVQGLLGKTISKRGVIQINTSTNTLIVTDVPESIQKVKEMVLGIDQPPMQVLIEAKLVDMSTTDAQNIGTVLSATYTPGGGNLSSASLTTGGSTSTSTTSSSTTDTTTTTTTGSGSAGGILDLVPNFKKFTNMDVKINALVQEQRARVLSAPSIATLNGQEARIIIGNKYPYKESTVTNLTTTQSVKYIDVGTTLKVTPMVSPDGWITMKVHPEVSSATPSTDGPVVSTREADATVRVRDNETVVIGGLISNVDSASKDGVPVLKSIPILGWFFKQHVSNDVKSELMVFITPHIIRFPTPNAVSPAPSQVEPVKVDVPTPKTEEVAKPAAPQPPKPKAVKTKTPNPPKSPQDAKANTPASPKEEAVKSTPNSSKANAAKLDMPNEVRIDSAALSQDSELINGLLSYVADLESSTSKQKGANNLYLKLEILKTYKIILKEFPQSGKGDYCLFKIASLYVKDFGKCGAAQEALAQLEYRFPQSSYLDATQSLVQACPKEAFIIREDPPVKILKK